MHLIVKPPVWLPHSQVWLDCLHESILKAWCVAETSTLRGRLSSAGSWTPHDGIVSGSDSRSLAILSKFTCCAEIQWHLNGDKHKRLWLCLSLMQLFCKGSCIFQISREWAAWCVGLTSPPSLITTSISVNGCVHFSSLSSGFFSFSCYPCMAFSSFFPPL